MNHLLEENDRNSALDIKPVTRAGSILTASAVVLSGIMMVLSGCAKPKPENDKLVLLSSPDCAAHYGSLPDELQRKQAIHNCTVMKQIAAENRKKAKPLHSSLNR